MWPRVKENFWWLKVIWSKASTGLKKKKKVISFSCNEKQRAPCFLVWVSPESLPWVKQLMWKVIARNIHSRMRNWDREGSQWSVYYHFIASRVNNTWASEPSHPEGIRAQVCLHSSPSPISCLLHMRRGLSGTLAYLGAVTSEAGQ